MNSNFSPFASLSLQRLRIFYTAAKSGRFAKAAEILGITQPAVSLQIRQLENHLGGKVFERTGTGIVLTELGEMAIQYTEQVLNLIKDLEDKSRQFTNIEFGSVKIGASSTPGNYILPTVIANFVELYPGIDVSLEISNTEKVVSQILSRRIDIGVGGRETTDNQLCSFAIDKDEIIIIASPKKANSLRNLDLQEVLSSMIVTREKGSATRAVAETYAGALNLTFGRKIELGSNEAVKSAVRNGVGVAMLSKHAVLTELTSGQLARIELEEWQCYRDLFVYYRCDGVYTPAQMKFIESLQKKSVE